MVSILFVCLGNICRSPTAEAVLRAKARAAGLDLVIDSAGTGDWHRGEPPYLPAIEAGLARGYDLRDLRARQVQPADFTRFDRIFAMDRANLADLNRLGRNEGTRPELLLPLAPDLGRQDLPDPWYTRDFEGTLDLVERACEALMDQLRDAAQPPQ